MPTANQKVIHDTDRKNSKAILAKNILSAPGRTGAESGSNTLKSLMAGLDPGQLALGKQLSSYTQGPGQNGLAQNVISQMVGVTKQQTQERKQDYTFPNKSEIEAFHAQLTQERIKSLNQRFINESNHTIKFSDFNKILNEEFKGKKPSDALVYFMFERFKRFKFQEGGHDIDRTQQMDILDFLLAMNFLARLVYEKKMRLMFELCDDDDDGCMRPAEILSMLQRAERIFAKECSKVDVDSTILLNMMADQKAEQKFQRIMSQIRQQNINKKIEQAQRDKQILDSKNASAAANGVTESKTTGNERGKLLNEEFDEDNLITYREFIQAVKSIKDVNDSNPNEKKFYESLLPRTLTFHEVLSVQKKEEEYKIHEDDVDEFVVFRYELSNILRKHLNDDEKTSSIFGGRHPLSKVGGRQLKEILNQKDLPNEKKKEFQEMYLEMYRPPGIIHNQAKIFERSDLPFKEKVWFCNPSSQVLVRQMKEAPALKQKDSQLSHDQMELRCREINMKLSLRENLKECRMRDLNFQQQYQQHLPPEADELNTLVESFKDKDSSKDKEIEKYKKNAEDKFRRVKNLVPENKVQISTLRMEEFEGDAPDRRNKSIMRAMNAHSVVKDGK